MSLSTEMTKLRRMLLAMGAGVEKRVSEAVDALLRRDMEEARHVRTGDDEIDAMDLDIEAECLRILALSHPVAGDLRFVLAATRINADLERMGDLAASMAKRVLALGEADAPIELPPPLIDMANATLRMLAGALTALAHDDVSSFETIHDADDEVDRLLKEIFDWAQRRIQQEVAMAPSVIDILSIARKLEHIADMTTNIAEDVVFITSGCVVRHDR
jgi:phosphate transport system protein